MFLLQVLEDGSVLGVNHDKADSLATMVRVISYIAAFYLNYVFAYPELSQEVDLIDYHFQLVDGILPRLHHICLHSVRFLLALVILTKCWRCVLVLMLRLLFQFS